MDSCKTQAAAQAAPQLPPPGDGRLRAGLHVWMVAPVLREFFHSVLKCKGVAVNATQQRDGNLKNRNKKVIRGFANRPVTHTVDRDYSTRAIGGKRPRRQVGPSKSPLRRNEQQGLIVVRFFAGGEGIDVLN